MKTLAVFIGLLSLSLGASAEIPAPAAVVGEFEYSGQYDVTKNQRVELVPTNAPNAAERVRRLQSDGHLCSDVADGKMCVKTYDSAVGSRYVQADVEKYFDNGWTLRLLPPVGDMKLIEDGENKKVWTVAQKALLPGKVTYYADYIWSAGAWTLELHQERGGTEGIFVDIGGNLKVPLEFIYDDELPGKQHVSVTANLQQIH